MLAPGVTSISATGDTAGVQINGQTTVDFTFNNNPEWQASGTNNFGVILTLGKFYNIGTGGSTVPCNIKLLAVVTPTNNGAATACPRCRSPRSRSSRPATPASAR